MAKHTSEAVFSYCSYQVRVGIYANDPIIIYESSETPRHETKPKVNIINAAPSTQKINNCNWNNL